MLKQLPAKRENDPSSDLGRKIGLSHSEYAVEESQSGNDKREVNDQGRVSFENAVIDDFAKDEWIRYADCRTNDYDKKNIANSPP